MPEKQTSIFISAQAEEWWRGTFIKPSGKKSLHYGLCLMAEIMPILFGKTREELSINAEADRIFTRLARRIRRIDEVMVGEQLLGLLADTNASAFLLKDTPEKTVYNIYSWLLQQSIWNRVVIDIIYIAKSKT